MIEKKIHYCWLSDDPFPAFIEQCINSWKKNMPDYEFCLWDRSRFDIESVLWVKQAFDAKKYAFAADYIRLYALYHEGGVYLDSDVEVLRNFDELLENMSFIGLETGGDFEPAIIGAQVGCEWVGRCLEYYNDRSFITPDGSLNTKPLPMIVGETLLHWYNIEPVVGPYPAVRLRIYSSDYFSPKSIHTKQIKNTSNTYCIHHFDGKWVKKNLLYHFKNITHSFLIFLLGQRIHNLIIKKLR